MAEKAALFLFHGDAFGQVPRLIHILAERFRITQAVGEYKARAALPPADPQREAAQIARLRALAEEANLDPEFSEKFIRFVIEEVIRHHKSARV